jgi:IS30 family transposase
VEIEDIEAVVHALNSRLRKIVGWKTPTEALNEHLLLLLQAGVAMTS